VGKEFLREKMLRLFDLESQRKRDLIREKEVLIWLDSDISSRYIYGRNTWGEQISQKFPNIGTFEEGNAENIFQTKLKKLNALSMPMGVLPSSALNRAKSISSSAVDAFTFLHFAKEYSLAPTFIQDMHLETNSHSEWYANLLNRFEDTISKNVFISIMNFRLSWDIDHLKDLRDLRKFQYLETFLELNEKDVFYDVGAFNGDSYQSLTEFFGNFAESYLFEPSEQNFNDAKNRLASNQSVRLFNIGLSNKTEVLHLLEDGSSSKTIPTGGQKFSAEKLDNIDITPPTFIKIDIEGMEEKFISGAAKTLENNRPKMAIAIYHNPFQLRNVIGLIDEIVPNCKFYLRHYTEGFTETILYVIPI
jgi:FkbM family methyltransferase